MKTATVRLRDIAFGGDAVGELEGKVIFVPYGIPGELVTVEVTREYARYAVARLVEVLEPSPDRVEPPCPHFGVCGGCQWQHIRYSRQLAFKQHIIQAQLERVARLSDIQVLPVIGMEEPWAYRNNVQYGVTPYGQLGFMAHHSHTLVPIHECWIAHPRLEDLAGAFDVVGADVTSLTLREGTATGEELVLLEGESEPEISVDFPVSCVYLSPPGELTVLAGDSYYHELLNQRLWRISAPSFFQVNTSQAERLVQEVSARAAADTPVLIDAYCGVGTFALSLASRFKRVIGIEESPWAVGDAQANRRENESVELIAGTTEALIAKYLAADSTVVLDPPRAGCAPEVLTAIIQARANRIIYVSCDPATLARDLRILVQGGYRPADIQPIDMFPQTGHVECVVSLSWDST